MFLCSYVRKISFCLQYVLMFLCLQTQKRGTPRGAPLVLYSQAVSADVVAQREVDDGLAAHLAFLDFHLAFTCQPSDGGVQVISTLPSRASHPMAAFRSRSAKPVAAFTSSYCHFRCSLASCLQTMPAFCPMFC